jgi:hypothetical protein
MGERGLLSPIAPRRAVPIVVPVAAPNEAPTAPSSAARLAAPVVAPLAAALLALVCAAAPARAQSLADRVESVRDGTIYLSFAARAGVCGSPGGGITMVTGGRAGRGDCARDHGPVHVTLTRRGGRTVQVHSRIGAPQRVEPDAVDLGTVSAPVAADYLLGLAATLDGAPAKDAIFPAVIADSAVVWPRLLEISRNRGRPQDVRKTAVFWLGQEAARSLAPELEGIVAADDDLEVRKAAIFALSLRPADEAVPALIRIARTIPDQELRRSAMFWLGQSDDPRAIDFFEEVLLGKRGS